MALSDDHAMSLHTAMVRLMRTAHAAVRHAPRPHDDIDSNAQMMLFKLVQEPRRISVLAEMAHCDVSTMSRQVSALTELGLITKTPDPDDGRAWRVTLTPEGRSAVDEATRNRAAWLAGLLASWTDADADSATTHLHRLADGLETSFTCDAHAGSDSHQHPRAADAAPATKDHTA